MHRRLPLIVPLVRPQPQEAEQTRLVVHPRVMTRPRARLPFLPHSSISSSNNKLFMLPNKQWQRSPRSHSNNNSPRSTEASVPERLSPHISHLHPLRLHNRHHSSSSLNRLIHKISHYHRSKPVSDPLHGHASGRGRARAPISWLSSMQFARMLILP